MHQIQDMFSTKSQGVTGILFPLLNINHLTTSENHIASYLSSRRMNRGRKNYKRNNVDRHNTFFAPFNASICVKNLWLNKSIISAGVQLLPPAFPLCTHPLMRREALCNVLGWSSEWPPHCTFGEKTNIIAAKSGCAIQWLHAGLFLVLLLNQNEQS